MAKAKERDYFWAWWSLCPWARFLFLCSDDPFLYGSILDDMGPDYLALMHCLPPMCFYFDCYKHSTSVWSRSWNLQADLWKEKKRHPSVLEIIKHSLHFWKLKKFKRNILCQKLLLFKNTLLVSQSAGVNCTMAILSLTSDLSLTL